jgi:hypothetical protein
MRSEFIRPFIVAATLCAAVTAARADVRIVLRHSGTPSYEETLYLKGSSQRREVRSQSRDGRTYNWALINDCARQQFIWLDLKSPHYWVETGGVPSAVFTAFNETQFPPSSGPSKNKRMLTETITVTDTGERREMFGFTARHLKTVTRWSIAPAACDTPETRIETDGWYIDLLYGVDCSPDLSGATESGNISFAGNGCLGKRFGRGNNYAYHRQYVGEARRGFPLSETTRAYNEHGLTSTSTREVLELSTDKLDDALFAVPTGYERVEPKEGGKPSIIGRALSIFR